MTDPTTDRIAEAAFKAAAETMCVIHMRPDQPPMAVPNDRDPRNRIAACYRCQKQARAALTAAYPHLFGDARADAWRSGHSWCSDYDLCEHQPFDTHPFLTGDDDDGEDA